MHPSTTTTTMRPEDSSSLFWRDSMGDFGVALFAPLSLPPQQQKKKQPASDWTKEEPSSSSPSPSNVVLLPPTEDNDSGVGGGDTTTGTRMGDSSTSSSASDDEAGGSTGVVDSDPEEEDPDSSSSSSSFWNVLLPEPEAQLQACPRLLTLEHVHELRQHLPTPLLQSYTWERCFAIGLHGDSFRTLVQTCQDYAHTVVVIRTTRGELLGGFASEPWRTTTTTTTKTTSSQSPSPTFRRPRQQQQRRQQSAYYGTGQSFVFASHPATVEPAPNCHPNDTNHNINDSSSSNTPSQPPLLHVYPWTGHNDYCQICDSQRRVLCMGGVGEFGWIVSDDFTVGQTGHCATFGNPPLTTSSSSFDIADLEIYGLASPLMMWYSSTHQHPSSSSSSMRTATTGSTSSLGT